MYRETLLPGTALLDVCSSLRSHLPPEMAFSRVVGTGINGEEMAANSRLDASFVCDLNTAAIGVGFFQREVGDASIGAVLCAAGIQYLTEPERVVAEFLRVLQPGGVAIVSFSNRWDDKKVIAGWRRLSGPERLQLVSSYFHTVGGFSTPQLLLQPASAPPTDDGTTLGWAAALLGSSGDPFFEGPFSAFVEEDPFYCVVAHKTLTAACGGR